MAVPVESSLPLAEIETRTKIHAGSVWLLALNLTAGLVLFGAAVALVVLAAVELNLGSPDARLAAVAPVLMAAAGLAWMGLLQIPSAWFALRGLKRGQPSSGWTPSPWLVSRMLPLSLAVFALVIWSGNQLASHPHLNAFALPVLHVVAISLPVIWVFVLGAYRLPPVSPRRIGAAFSLSLTVGPFSVILLETGLLVIFLAAWLAYLFQNPAALETLSALGQSAAQIQDLADAQRIVGPYLGDLRILAALIFFASVCVPLIEEMLKPLGVYFFLRRGISPQRGFVLGMAGGAGYALFESLLMIGSGAEWHLVVLGRAVTSLLHITNSGLVGWALASLWGSRTGRSLTPARAGGALAAYLFAVIAHGLWNGLTILAAWTTLLEGIDPSPAAPFILEAGKYAPYGLGLLTIVFIVILIRMHLLLGRKAQAHPENAEMDITISQR